MKTPLILLTLCIMANMTGFGQIVCDTIPAIDDEPVFFAKNFKKKQTKTAKFYLLNGSFQFRVKGNEQTYLIEEDTKNNIRTYQFGMSGFQKTDTLVFRTHDNLFFFFTDFRYISKNGECVLSDTVTINGKQQPNTIIFPKMGIPHTKLDTDLMLRFYWDDVVGRE